ncbi:MAG TPA: CHAT domain-containing protein [Jatrophihabitans sp.]
MTELVDRARALHERGVGAQNRGQPQLALRLLHRARGLADDSADAALHTAILISIALNTAELSGPQAGLEIIDEALRRADHDRDLGLLMRAHSQRALIALRAGRFVDAVDALAAAEELLTHADANDQFAVLLNGGTLRMYRGELAAAHRSISAAVVVAREADMAVAEFKALHNLGYLEFLRGDLPAALRDMDAALDVGVDMPVGIPLLDHARVLAEAGLTHAADDSLARAADIFRRDRLAQDLGETELERARCALIADEPEAARRFAMRARDRFRRRGNDRWRRSAELVLLQGDLAAGRPGTRLVGPAARLRAEFERDGVRLPAQTAALIAAEAHLSAGQVQSAADALATLGRTGRHDPITTRLHRDYVRARLDVAIGHRAAARRRARRALDDLAGYQASFGSIDLATAAAVHGRRLADLDLALAVGTGRAELALESAERARAVAGRLPAVRPPEDPETAELLSELRQAVEALRPVEQDRDASAPLLARRRDLEARIAARGWTRAGGRIVTDPVSLDDLRGALDDTTLLSYSRVGTGLVAVVVTRDTLRLVPIGAADPVDEQVRRVRADLDVHAQPHLPEPLRAAVRSSLRRSLATLDSTLLGHFGPSGRLVVVTTGLLGQLPWGLLPSLRGVPVVVTPSATAWHRAHTQAPTAHRKVVALAGPGLSRGVEEAGIVARTWDVRRVVTGFATAADFTQALATARVAHVAAHGTHQSENPLFSSVRLADGPLFAHELDQTARTPDHVVLSACELGLATIRPGDEALGLTSVLLHLGTRSVVAGVARVGDDVAAAAMADYHQRLRRRSDSALALAGTLVDHPSAPFVCFGATFHS